MKRLLLCLTLALAGVLAACQTSEPPPPVQAPRLLDRDAQGPRATQAWLMLGDGPVYLLSLGDEQAVLEVQLRKPRVDALAIYRDDRRITGEPTYVLETEPLAKEELVKAHGNWPRRTSFKATLVRGERGHGGEPFLAGVSVTVKRVLLARPVPSMKALVPPALTYFLFGEGKELYALHLRRDRTGFDHLASVRLLEGIDSEDEAEAVRRGTLASFPARPDDQRAALVPEQTSDGLVRIRGEKGQRPVTVETLRDVYSPRISTFDF